MIFCVFVQLDMVISPGRNEVLRRAGAADIIKYLSKHNWRSRQADTTAASRRAGPGRFPAGFPQLAAALKAQGRVLTKPGQAGPGRWLAMETMDGGSDKLRAEQRIIKPSPPARAATHEEIGQCGRRAARGRRPPRNRDQGSEAARQRGSLAATPRG